jgi:hypothetical protein
VTYSSIVRRLAYAGTLQRLNSTCIDELTFEGELKRWKFIEKNRFPSDLLKLIVTLRIREGGSRTTNTEGKQWRTPTGDCSSDALMRVVKKKFHYVDSDFTGRKRLYFDGSIKLASVGYFPG